jgi:hypothetical protein
VKWREREREREKEMEVVEMSNSVRSSGGELLEIFLHIDYPP